MACYHPSLVDVESDLGSSTRRDAVRVPCGSCLGCRADQARSWAIRMMHESTMHAASWFLTLTYSPEELPENGSLEKEAVTDFVRDLRDLERYRAEKAGQKPVRFSYYGCGEYGSQTKRPHYHLVLFGPRFPGRALHRHVGHNPVWVSRDVAECWPRGLHEFSGISYAAARYVAGYVVKKQKRLDRYTKFERYDPETGEVLDVVPEFARMSRRPAIGRRWLEKFWPDVYPRDFVMQDGHPVKPPRYYDKVMEEINPQLMEEVKHQRWIDAVEIGDEKLIMKEKVHRARNALYSQRSKV